jgi:hypothetical protein
VPVDQQVAAGRNGGHPQPNVTSPDLDKMVETYEFTMAPEPAPLVNWERATLQPRPTPLDQR